MEWRDAVKPVLAAACAAAVYKLAVSSGTEGAGSSGTAAHAAGASAQTTAQRVLQRLRVAKWLLGFSALQSAALARLAGRRLLGTQRHHTRNALPAKVDLLVTLLKTGIAGAPPSVAVIRRYVVAARPAQDCTSPRQPCRVHGGRYIGSGIGGVRIPPHVASVKRISMQVPRATAAAEAHCDRSVGASGGTAATSAAGDQGSGDDGTTMALEAEWVRHVSVPPTARPVVLYLHGGAYCFGSAGSHRDLAARLSKAAHAHVVMLEYTLADEAPFPAALYDALAAYAWLLSPGSCSLPGGARLAREVVVGGDSAGGGLTAAVLLALRERATLGAPCCLPTRAST